MPATPAKPGYAIVVPEKPTAGEQKGARRSRIRRSPNFSPAPIVTRGQASANKCVACHTFDKGGRNLVGPNLYGVIGREKGSVAGLQLFGGYRKTMKGPWTAQDLSDFVEESESHGARHHHDLYRFPRTSERADLIAFLNSKSDNPQPLSKAAQAK